MVNIIFPDGTTLATVIANLNVFTSNPDVSIGEGEIIYNSTNNKPYVNIGTAGTPNWSDISGSGGVVDHGALTGLGDDDHTQYLLVNGTRDMTGTLDMGTESITNINSLFGVSGFNLDVYTSGAKLCGFETSSLNMNSHKITSLATPTLTTDAATKAYVDGKTWDHGALTGLADDDHSQYYNSTRHTKTIHDSLAIDHGSLGGKDDDDHSQYLLASGSRDITGDIRMVGGNSYEFTDPSVTNIFSIKASGNYLYIDGSDGGQSLLDIDGSTLETTLYGALDINGKITGLSTPTADYDAATKKYVDDNTFYNIENQSFTNLLENGDFESWSAGSDVKPDRWTNGFYGSIARNSSPKIGTYCMALTRSGTNSYLFQPITNYSYYLERDITFGMWIKTSTANQAQILIETGAGIFVSSYHTGGGDWEWLTVSITFPEGANKLLLHCRVITTDGTAYFDGAILVEGSVCPAFSPKPLVDDGKTLQIDSATNSVTIGREPTVDAEAATKKYVDTIGGWAGTATSDLNMDDYNITNTDTIQAKSTNSLTFKVSIGKSFVFQKV